MNDNSAAMLIANVGQAVSLVIRVYYFLVIAHVILSWVQLDPRNPIVRFIHRTTDPVFDLVRRTLPFLQAGGIDFSPIVVLLLLELLARVVAKLFEQLAISTIH